MPRWEDSITLQRRLTGQSFVDAVRALTGACWPATAIREPARRAAPTLRWQAMARRIAAEAAAQLWRPAGRSTLEWLQARGLRDDTLRRWRLGWLPKTLRFPAQHWGLSGKPLIVPAGITIPYSSDLALKVRRFASELLFRVQRGKYWFVRGSDPGLYLVETLTTATSVCLTEGELDALLLLQELRAHRDMTSIGVITSGSQSPHPRPEWLAQLSGKPLLLLHDQDVAGEQGAARWQAARPDAVRIRWPQGNDVTDYHRAGGDLAALVEHSLVAEHP
jgi:hypothetical protein